MAPFQLPPIEVIATWPVPNYVNPVTRGDVNLIMNCVFFPIVVLIIAIRIFARLRISKSFGLDDWLIVLALVPTAAFGIICLVANYTLGWNRHIWDVKYTGSGVATGLKMIMVVQVMFSLASTLTKLSMLALTYRIVANGSSRLAKWIIAAGVLVAADSLLFCLLIIFQCRPISLYWAISFTTQTSCIAEGKHLLAAGTINTITDLIVVLLPIPTVLGVQIPRREAMIIILLFSAGLIGTSAGAVRTYFTYKVTKSDDKSWDIYLTWMASNVELYIGIICTSLPATKKFFSRYVPILLRSNSTAPIATPVWTSAPSSRRNPKFDSINSDDVTPEVELDEHDEHSSDHDEKTKEQDSNIWVETKVTVRRGTPETDETRFGTVESRENLVLVPKRLQGRTKTYSCGPSP